MKNPITAAELKMVIEKRFAAATEQEVGAQDLYFVITPEQYAHSNANWTCTAAFPGEHGDAWSDVLENVKVEFPTVDFLS